MVEKQYAEYCLERERGREREPHCASTKITWNAEAGVTGVQFKPTSHHNRWVLHCSN